MSEAKRATVALLAERLRSAKGAILTDYRGLTVAQVAELRHRLKGNAEYTVVKNTLTKIAVSQGHVHLRFTDLLTGPSAIAFVDGDAAEAARSLRDFAKSYPALVIKGGIIDGQDAWLEDIERLADTEPRDVLLARLAAAMKAPMERAAATMAAPATKMAQLARALEQKGEGDEPVPSARR